jgi:hypothetical protein
LNAEHRTLNIEQKSAKETDRMTHLSLFGSTLDVRRSMFDVRVFSLVQRWMFDVQRSMFAFSLFDSTLDVRRSTFDVRVFSLSFNVGCSMFAFPSFGLVAAACDRRT